MAEQDIYLGNPNLKKANTRTEFSAKQVQEFIKCKKDPIYFAKNLIIWKEVIVSHYVVYHNCN